MRRHKIIILAGALSLALPEMATAQEAAQGVGVDHSTDIIVTARKREESVLDVPVIASVLSQEAIQSRQLVDLREMQRVVPTLTLGENNGALGTQVSLRGVGTTAINANIDASVALNIDGLQITQATSYQAAMFDIGRIEVLKGPQSLFFGKNSPGGVIALRTADPTDDTEVMARLGYEGLARQTRAEFILSGPVSDTLKLRFAGMYDMQDGYFRNIGQPGPFGARLSGSRRAPDNRNWIVRGTTLWEPSADFTARLKVNITRDRSVGGETRQLVSCPDGTGAVAPLNIPFIGPNEDCKLDRKVNLLAWTTTAFPLSERDGTPFKELNHEFGTLELNYQISPYLALNSTTGYYHMKFRSQLNGSSASYAGTPFFSAAEPLDREDVTQELRLSSEFEGPLNFLVGVFYQDARIDNSIDLPSNMSLPLALGSPTPDGRARRLSRYQHLIDIEAYSGFGQLRWDVVPQLELAAGARWVHEKRKLQANLFDNVTGEYVDFPTAVPRISSENVSPEFTATFKPAENLSIFGSYKVAYKSGSFDTTALSGVLPDYAFDDEKAEGFEGGIKGQILDRSLFFSLAGYRYKYKGLQVGAVEPITTTGGVPINRTLNAGAARVYGAELDVNFSPRAIEGLTLRGALAYTNARFLRLNNAPCWGGQTVTEGCNQIFVPAANQAQPPAGSVQVDGQFGNYRAQDLSGVPLVRAPKWQASFGFTYEIPMENDWSLSLANTNQFSSRYLTVLGRRDDFWAGSYFKTDLSLALKGKDDRWEVALIGKNLTDKITATTCTSSNVQAGSVLGGQFTGGIGRGPAGVDEVGCYGDRGRELWVRLTLRPAG